MDDGYSVEFDHYRTPIAEYVSDLKISDKVECPEGRIYDCAGKHVRMLIAVDDFLSIVEEYNPVTKLPMKRLFMAKFAGYFSFSSTFPGSAIDGLTSQLPAGTKLKVVHQKTRRGITPGTN